MALGFCFLLVGGGVKWQFWNVKRIYVSHSGYKPLFRVDYITYLYVLECLENANLAKKC